MVFPDRIVNDKKIQTLIDFLPILWSDFNSLFILNSRNLWIYSINMHLSTYSVLKSYIQKIELNACCCTCYQKICHCILAQLLFLSPFASPNSLPVFSCLNWLPLLHLSFQKFSLLCVLLAAAVLFIVKNRLKPMPPELTFRKLWIRMLYCNGIPLIM